MEYLLVYGTSFKLYHSFSRLCRDNDLNPKEFDKNKLPVKTPKGFIYSIMPDTRV